MKSLIALILALVLAGCANTAREQAVVGGAGDVISTGLAISNGFTELNPLGAGATALLKPAIVLWADSLPDTEQAAAHSTIGSIWTGAAASNVCLLVTGSPLCYAIGAYTGYKVYEHHADERNFWAICASERKDKPELECSYYPRGTVWAAN